MGIFLLCNFIYYTSELLLSHSKKYSVTSHSENDSYPDMLPSINQSQFLASLLSCCKPKYDFTAVRKTYQIIVIIGDVYETVCLCYVLYYILIRISAKWPTLSGERGSPWICSSVFLKSWRWSCGPKKDEGQRSAWGCESL